MSLKRKIIIDTDPGIDDILALLLAFSAKPEEIEILLVSLTFGNVEVTNCLRNAVSLFHVIETELKWRQSQGKASGFESLKAHKPLVAVGSQEPLEDQKIIADYFHGVDGLGGVHTSHPHFTPVTKWEHLFDPLVEPPVQPPQVGETSDGLAHQSFIPSKKPAPEEILRILRENEPGTVTIVAVGPLTNLAVAAAADPDSFLRVKEVVIMGGAVNEPGNITPYGEFNVFADAVAAAKVFALTSPNPSTTLPPARTDGPNSLAIKPSKPLQLRLFPLDITLRHHITRGQFRKIVAPLVTGGSPLAEWVSVFMAHAFSTVEERHTGNVGDDSALSLHDPLCIYYALTADDPRWKPTATSPEDIRIETTGQWTRGMCVVDRRNRHREDGDVESPSDRGLWLSANAGNRIWRMNHSPCEDRFGEILFERIFG